MPNSSDDLADAGQLARCLANFGLKADEWAVTQLAEGVDNLNLLVERGGDRWVLRRYDITPASEAIFEVQLLDFLRKKSFPTPGLKTTMDGALLSLLDTRAVAMFEFIPGRHGKPESTADANAVARLVAQLHNVTFDFKAPCARSRTDFNRIQDLSRDVNEFRYSRDRIAEFAETASRLAEIAAQQINSSGDIPRGLIHHDPNPENVLFDSQGRLVALLDFDESHVAPLVSDIVSLIHYWAPPYIDIEKAAQLIRVYDEGRKLSAAECRFLPHYIRLQYAADAAEYLTRQLKDDGNRDVDIDSCNSYRHFVELRDDSIWAERLVSSLGG